jgi:hypothetical protein
MVVGDVQFDQHLQIFGCRKFGGTVGDKGAHVRQVGVDGRRCLPLLAISGVLRLVLLVREIELVAVVGPSGSTKLLGGTKQKIHARGVELPQPHLLDAFPFAFKEDNFRENVKREGGADQNVCQ